MYTHSQHLINVLSLVRKLHQRLPFTRNSIIKGSKWCNTATR